MSVIQDALQRKLEEQRAAKDSRASQGRPEPQPPQAPPVAQQVFENEAALYPPPSVPVHQKVPATRRPVRSDAQRTIRLLLISIIVMLSVGLVGAVIYFIDAGKSELLSSAPSVPGNGVGPAAQSDSAQIAGTAAPSGAAHANGTASSPIVQSAPDDSGKWPLVEVGGVVASGSSKNNSAILSGDMIRINRMINGVCLVNVSDDGVTLEYGGDQRFVEIGATTRD